MILFLSNIGQVRVNSISPGWIDTDFIEYTGADAVQQPVHRVGNPMDKRISNVVAAEIESDFGENSHGYCQYGTVSLL